MSGTSIDLYDNPADQAAIQKLLRAHACIPVFLPKEAREGHFNYASTVLWPMMHNQIPDRHALKKRAHKIVQKSALLSKSASPARS